MLHTFRVRTFPLVQRGGRRAGSLHRNANVHFNYTGRGSVAWPDENRRPWIWLNADPFKPGLPDYVCDCASSLRSFLPPLRSPCRSHTLLLRSRVFSLPSIFSPPDFAPRGFKCLETVLMAIRSFVVTWLGSELQLREKRRILGYIERVEESRRIFMNSRRIFILTLIFSYGGLLL